MCQCRRRCESHVRLPEKQGLLVMLVAKDSPGGEGGHRPVRHSASRRRQTACRARDLVAAVEAAKETKLKIDLIRGGKPKTIEVTPAKWPAAAGAVRANARARPIGTRFKGGWRTRCRAKGRGSPASAQFRIFHPGAIVPNNVLVAKPLPTNMSVSVSKEGNQPAKITVQRGNDKWELTEKELNKLPADVRPFVEQMLGRGMVGVVGGAVPPGMSSGFSTRRWHVSVLLASRAMLQPQPFPGSLDQQMIEKRFDEMNRRMDQLFKMMEELSEGHQQHAAPPHQGKK